MSPKGSLPLLGLMIIIQSRLKTSKLSVYVDFLDRMSDVRLNYIRIFQNIGSKTIDI